MHVRGWLPGVFGPGLAVLALAPAAASAAEAPVLTSMTPNEIGSNGGQKVIIHGEKFIPTSVVHYAGQVLIVTATGTAAKGHSVEKSATEIEMNPPFHEHGKQLVQVCSTEPAPEACSSATQEPGHNQMTIWGEVYRNEAAIGSGHVPLVGYGELFLNSPQINDQFECVNFGFGAAWNEAPAGQANPISGHGEMLVWWASGHAPKSGHTELSSRCRFISHGVEENLSTSPVGWATAEAPLHEVLQEGEVCSKTGVELSECLIPGEETEIRTVIREVTREGLSLPWNIQFTEKSEKPRVRFGLPDECKGKTGAERTELSKCPEASEREPGKSPEACNIPPTPDPAGCVKAQFLTNPPLNLHLEFEGYLEPRGINSGPSGLSPSSLEFEGVASGEPVLHLSETTTTEGSATGSVKIIGFGAQELMTAK